MINYEIQFKNQILKLFGYGYMFIKAKEKALPLAVSLFLVALFTMLFIINPKHFKKGLEQLENLTYDLQVRSNHKPLGPEAFITIVDIDDKSLKEKGRWPWSRKLLAELVEQLFQGGAAIVALDLTFPDVEENIATDVLRVLKSQTGDHSKAIEELNGLQTDFNYDKKLAKSLALGDSILGFVFSDGGGSAGVLPPPVLVLDKEMQEALAIPDKMDYLSNIEALQESAKSGGFINASRDPDGVLRFTHLLLRRGANVYGSLALQAASFYLLTKNVALVTEQYGNSQVLEGIKLDQLMIPTDPMGRILIPYRGFPFSFPYVSASDILNGKAAASSIEGKLIFIGFSAAALADLYSTSIDPVFPGVEIHATIASGIIDQYLPYKPYWGNGVIIFLLIFCGAICALLLPFLGAVASSLICFGLTAGIVTADNGLWANGIVLDTIVPIVLIWTLFIFNLAWGYFIEAKRGKELKSIFGQYVPPAYLDEMMKKGGEINLEGESKELSVLFSDIRSFTNLSEKMTASEIKKFLNRFFNPITEVIFNNKGTIDKYVGDMVMAFWGAPLDNPKHASQAVATALEMQEKLAELNQVFHKEGKPEIKIGIGINTGLMNVGDMGSKFRRSYTVIGDAVNLASRLEGQGKYYHIAIMVGEITWQQTKDEFVYRKIDKIKVKGKETAVEVFQPICTLQSLTPALKQELENHHQAMEAYFQQDWQRATNLFEALKASYPDHAGLYEVYLSRIADLRLQPFKEGWDGSYASLEK